MRNGFARNPAYSRYQKGISDGQKICLAHAVVVFRTCIEPDNGPSPNPNADRNGDKDHIDLHDNPHGSNGCIPTDRRLIAIVKEGIVEDNLHDGGTHLDQAAGSANGDSTAQF